MSDTSGYSPQGPLSLVASMAHTRLELASIDLQRHIAATLAALLMGLAAFVLALIAFAFIGVAVIAFFWDTHRVVATVATTLSYAGLATAMTWYARARWRARPPAFAAVLRELELDAEALRRLR